MIAFPNAKINLGLWVLEKRADHFHEIESCFFPINCCDTLEIIPNSQKSSAIFLYGNRIEGKPNENLVLKAFKLVQKSYQIPFCDIHLIKNIPSKSGLGGGSSDAVSTLKTLNALFQLNITNREFHGFCSQLGSDCHFFVQNKPAMVFGRGENVSQPIILEEIKGKKLVLVFPNLDISTPKAYEKIKPHKRNKTIREIVVGKKIETWKELLINDFEASAFLQYPNLASIKEKLYCSGALYASMSGSGSAMYGIFDENIEEELVRSILKGEKIVFETIS